jgi:hypothetical protein
MNPDMQSRTVRGKTVRFTWLDGPTKGKVHEHVFHEDGTVEWHDAGGAKAASGAKAERPPYAALDVADDVCAVSYLAPSGFTLTVVLNFKTRRLVGFASGGKEWHPVGGTFEVVRHEP